MKNINRYIKTRFSVNLHTIFIISLILVIALTAAGGCAAQKESGPTPTPILLPTPTPGVQPALGGELILSMPRNPFKSESGVSANPLIINTEEMRALYSIVYEPLVICNETNTISPRLAERWSVNDTGMVWTFELRQNVFWHDGENELSANDVKHTIDLIKSLGEECFYYPLVESYIDYAEVVDSKTILIKMKEQGISALYSLTFPIICANGQSGALNGTGPYKVSYNTETTVELIVNELWWRQTPYIQKVRFLARENNDVALNSYEAGQLNMVPTSNVSAGRHREEGVTNVLDVYTQDCEMLLINFSNSNLRNIEVRQAIAYALNRSEIVSNVYMNKAVISDVPVPPDSYFYDPSSKVYDRDLAKAQELLSAAGWVEKNEDGILVKNGRKLSFNLIVNDSVESSYRKSAANLIAAQLLDVGIEINVIAEKLALGEAGSDYEERLQAGNFDLAMLGFNIERSGNLKPYLSLSGSRNYGRYSNEQITTYVNKAVHALDEQSVKEAQSELQHAIVSDLPFITLYFRQSSIVYSADIQGVSDIRMPDILRTISRWYMNYTQ